MLTLGAVGGSSGRVSHVLLHVTRSSAAPHTSEQVEPAFLVKKLLFQSLDVYAGSSVLGGSM